MNSLWVDVFASCKDNTLLPFAEESEYVATSSAGERHLQQLGMPIWLLKHKHKADLFQLLGLVYIHMLLVRLI